MTPRSVLVVSPIPSHPAMQGNAARIQAVAVQLRARGIVPDFFYYGMEGLSPDQAEEMKRFWNRFIFMKSLPLPQSSMARTWGLDDWCAEALCQQVKSVCERHAYDAVIVNYVWMSKLLERLDGPLRILDTHDLFGDRHLVAEEASMEPRWFFTTLAEENRGFARADVVIGIQDNEAAAIRRRFTGETITVGHPAEPHFLLRQPRAEPSFTFGYLGSANPFNVTSLVTLDRTLSEGEPMDWVLAGSISRKRLNLDSRPYRMGLVDRLEDFYDNVQCVLNPMIGGTGLKIKTIEALSYGKPVIGTADAFEGIASDHPFHRLSGIDDFAEAMRSYIRSQTLRDELQRQSYTVFSRYMAGVTGDYDRLANLIRAGRTRQPLEAARPSAA
jgi:glycosyltransferase involved in cell wall biosynthesis